VCDDDLDRVLQRWWDELPRSRRRLARQLTPGDEVPEDLVVTLLLYGVIAPEELSPPGHLQQPDAVRNFLDGRGG